MHAQSVHVGQTAQPALDSPIPSSEFELPPIPPVVDVTVEVVVDPVPALVDESVAVVVVTVDEEEELVGVGQDAG